MTNPAAEASVRRKALHVTVPAHRWHRRHPASRNSSPTAERSPKPCAAPPRKAGTARPRLSWNAAGQARLLMRVYMAARDAGRNRFTSATFPRPFLRPYCPNLTKSPPNPDLEQGVLRSLQAEMIAQCRPLIVGAEQASLLQNRHHEPHEILKTFVEIRRPHV